MSQIIDSHVISTLLGMRNSDFTRRCWSYAKTKNIDLPEYSTQNVGHKTNFALPVELAISIVGSLHINQPNRDSTISWLAKNKDLTKDTFFKTLKELATELGLPLWEDYLAVDTRVVEFPDTALYIVWGTVDLHGKGLKVRVKSHLGDDARILYINEKDTLGGALAKVTRPP